MATQSAIRGSDYAELAQDFLARIVGQLVDCQFGQVTELAAVGPEKSDRSGEIRAIRELSRELAGQEVSGSRFYP